MLIAASTTPVFTVSLASIVTIAAALLGFADSAWRFKRPGGNAVLAVVSLLLAVLLFVRAFGPVQEYVSTSLPVLTLSVALTVALLVQLLVRTARKSGVLWLSILATLAAGAAAVIAFLRIA